jgi:hypothetical protein
MAMADMACARGVIEKRSGSTIVVVIVAQASGSKTRREVQLSAYWITKKHDVVSLQRMCNHCKDDALPKTVDELMSDLSKLVPAMTAKVEISSTPPGLLALVDGQAAGMTPIEHEVTPGPHEVALARNGKILEKRSVTIGAGDSTRVSFVAPIEKPQLVVIHHSRTLPAIMLGLGVAAGAAGSVMIVKGGPTGESMYYRNYRTPGIGIAAGGGALALAGVILLLRGDSKEMPVATVTRDGAVVGWARSF